MPALQTLITLAVFTAARATCPYEAISKPCLIGSDGIVTVDCIIGKAGRPAVHNFGKLSIPKGVRLLFDRRQNVDIRVSADGIKVEGEIWAGCEGNVADSFQGNLLVELIGNYQEQNNKSRWVGFSWKQAGLPDIGYGAAGETFPKSLVVAAGGRLELHGTPKLSWRYLAEWSSAKSRTLVVNATVDWKAGDEIIVGSTSPVAGQSEVAIVAFVNCSTVHLRDDLKHDHGGDLRGPAEKLRAPIGLRSRNIVIRGRMSDGSKENERQAWSSCQQAYRLLDPIDPEPVREKCFGGHAIFMQHSMVHIEFVEFSSMGQALIMARYPVHWHLAGNASGSYLRNSSLHNNFQRCVTVHGTANVAVEGNVCHDTFGHAFYLEDGIETGNEFRQNLIVSVHPGGSVCTDFEKARGGRVNVQLGPAGFWITNPDNIFESNHVSDVGTGYWFTFPVAKNEKCSNMPGRLNGCDPQGSRGVGDVFGPSRMYFDDAASGFGRKHWWTNQEQSRTPVRLFRGNVVVSSQRGIYVDGRVYGSSDAYLNEQFPGGPVPCLSDGCPTCAGPLEGSFTWTPMVFNQTASPKDRVYEPTVNKFENFAAANIMGWTQVEQSRGMWVSGGSMLFTAAVFLNVFSVVAAFEDLTGGCRTVASGTPPGFSVVFQDSVFTSGPQSNVFFEIYDAGIYVSHSRWSKGSGTKANFAVAKPKAAFGGNGNPIVVHATGPLGKISSDRKDSRFSWAFHAPRRNLQPKHATAAIRIADFRFLGWSSPYTSGSYIYSTDSFISDTRRPMIVAASVEADTALRSKTIAGKANCRDYLYRTPPRFYCGPAFGQYGLWCGDDRLLCQCRGAVDDAREWYRSLPPWNATDAAAACTNPAPAPTFMADGHASQDGQLGSCSFPAPPVTPFTWDAECRRKGGGLGCNADGFHLECRWCGFGVFPKCRDKAHARDMFDSPQGNQEKSFDKEMDSAAGEAAIWLSVVVAMGCAGWVAWLRKRSGKTSVACCAWPRCFSTFAQRTPAARDKSNEGYPSHFTPLGVRTCRSWRWLSARSSVRVVPSPDCIKEI